MSSSVSLDFLVLKELNAQVGQGHHPMRAALSNCNTQHSHSCWNIIMQHVSTKVKWVAVLEEQETISSYTAAAQSQGHCFEELESYG
jgi:hypothetical protein